MLQSLRSLAPFVVAVVFRLLLLLSTQLDFLQLELEFLLLPLSWPLLLPLLSLQLLVPFSILPAAPVVAEVALPCQAEQFSTLLLLDMLPAYWFFRFQLT